MEDGWRGKVEGKDYGRMREFIKNSSQTPCFIVKMDVDSWGLGERRSMAHLACPTCFCEVKEVGVKLIGGEKVIWLQLEHYYCLHCKVLVDEVVEVREEVRA